MTSMTTTMLKYDFKGLSSSDVPVSWVTSGRFVNTENQAVQSFLAKALASLPSDANDREKAIRLFDAVRDDIRYNPYQLSFEATDYEAGFIANLDAAYCVPKAILLASCLRAVGIPAGVGFADVQNHLNSPKLADVMQTDLFMYHGYVALRLGDETYKVTPTFNQELCDRFGVQAIEFDGHSDALFHEYDAAQRQHMEYVNDRGIFEEPPVPEILVDLAIAYPKMKSICNGEAAKVMDAEFSS
jgi:transglutaminase-like putative cysteine protease